MCVDAPLQEIANPAKTENPAKAPWYFLALQELLVYFDPWVAGVVIPGIIVAGLMAIPYIDRNPLGKNYYTFRERKFAISMFTIGFCAWFTLMFIGMHFRGPSWQWYWPWESWAVHKQVTSLVTSLFWQEHGLYIVMGYYFFGLFLPMLVCRKFFKTLGFIRYSVVMMLALTMFGVFGKIFLRLIFDVKYIIQTPWFNI